MEKERNGTEGTLPAAQKPTNVKAGNTKTDQVDTGKSAKKGEGKTENTAAASKNTSATTEKSMPKGEGKMKNPSATSDKSIEKNLEKASAAAGKSMQKGKGEAGSGATKVEAGPVATDESAEKKDDEAGLTGVTTEEVEVVTDTKVLPLELDRIESLPTKEFFGEFVEFIDEALSDSDDGGKTPDSEFEFDKTPRLQLDVKISEGDPKPNNNANQILKKVSLMRRKSAETEDIWKHVYLEYEVTEYRIEVPINGKKEILPLRGEQKRSLADLQQRMIKYLNEEPSEGEECWAGPMFQWDPIKQMLVYITIDLSSCPILCPDLEQPEITNRELPEENATAVPPDKSDPENFNPRRRDTFRAQQRAKAINREISTLLNSSEIDSLSNMTPQEAHKRLYKKIKTRYSQHLQRRWLHPDHKSHIKTFLGMNSMDSSSDKVPRPKPVSSIQIRRSPTAPRIARQPSAFANGIDVSVCHLSRNLYFSFDASQSNTIGQLKERLQKVGGYLYGNQILTLEDDKDKKGGKPVKDDDVIASLKSGRCVTLMLKDANDIGNKNLFPTTPRPSPRMSRKRKKVNSPRAVRFRPAQNLAGKQSVFFGCPLHLLRIILPSGSEYPLNEAQCEDLQNFRSNPPRANQLLRLTAAELERKRKTGTPDFTDVFEGQLRIAKDVLDKGFIVPPEGVIFCSSSQSRLSESFGSGREICYFIPPNNTNSKFEIREAHVFYNTKITRYMRNLMLVDKLSKKRKAQYRKAFRLCDADGNGVISTEEIRTNLMPMLKLNDDVLTKALLADASMDGDNELSLMEFMVLVARNMSEIAENTLGSEGSSIQLEIVLRPLKLAWCQYGRERTGTVILEPNGTVTGQGCALGLNYWKPCRHAELMLSKDIDHKHNRHMLLFNDDFVGFSCNRGQRGYLLRSCAYSPDNAGAPPRDSSYRHDGPLFRCMTSLDFQSDESVPVEQSMQMTDDPPVEAKMDPGRVKRKYVQMLAEATEAKDKTCSAFVPMPGFSRLCRKCNQQRDVCEKMKTYAEEEVLRYTTRWRTMQDTLRARHVTACVLRDEPYVSDVKETCSRVLYMYETTDDFASMAEDLCAAAVQTIRSDLLSEFVFIISPPRTWFKEKEFQRKCCSEAIKLGRADFLQAMYRTKMFDVETPYFVDQILELSAATTQTPLSPLEEYHWDRTLLMLAAGLAQNRMAALDSVVASVIVDAAKRQLHHSGFQEWDVRLSMAQEDATRTYNRSMLEYDACDAFQPIGKRSSATFLETLIFTPLVKIFASRAERIPAQSPKNSSFSRRARRSSNNNPSASVSPGHHKAQRLSSGAQPYLSRPAMRQSFSESRIAAPGPLHPRKSQSFNEIASPTIKPSLAAAMRNNTTHPDAQTAHEAKSLLECTVLPRMKEVLQLQIDHSNKYTDVLREVYVERKTSHKHIYLNILQQLKDSDFEEFNGLTDQMSKICKENLKKRGCTTVEQHETDFIELFVTAFDVEFRFRKFMKKLQSKTLGEYTPVAVKGVHRSLEKMGLRFDDKQWVADNICDCVRGAVVYGDMRTMRTMLCLLASACKDERLCGIGQRLFGHAASAGIHEKINILRVKNRFANPTAGGWADVNVSFCFEDDPQQHVVEVQLVHRNLFNVRNQMGAHKSYAEFRSALELLEANGHHDIIEECDAVSEMDGQQWVNQNILQPRTQMSLAESNSLQDRVTALEQLLESTRATFLNSTEILHKQISQSQSEIRRLRHMLRARSTRSDASIDDLPFASNARLPAARGSPDHGSRMTRSSANLALHTPRGSNDVPFKVPRNSTMPIPMTLGLMNKKQSFQLPRKPSFQLSRQQSTPMSRGMMKQRSSGAGPLSGGGSQMFQVPRQQSTPMSHGMMKQRLSGVSQHTLQVPRQNTQPMTLGMMQTLSGVSGGRSKRSPRHSIGHWSSKRPQSVNFAKTKKIKRMSISHHPSSPR